MEIEPERLQRAIQTVVDRSDPDQIILFESAARGEIRADSDIDLLAVRERARHQPETWRERWQSDTEDELDVGVADRRGRSEASALPRAAGRVPTTKNHDETR